MCDCETYSLPPSLPPSFYPHLPTPLVPQKKEILRKEKKEKKRCDSSKKKVIINIIKKIYISSLTYSTLVVHIRCSEGSRYRLHGDYLIHILEGINKRKHEGAKVLGSSPISHRL